MTLLILLSGGGGGGVDDHTVLVASSAFTLTSTDSGILAVAPNTSGFVLGFEQATIDLEITTGDSQYVLQSTMVNGTGTPVAAPVLPVGGVKPGGPAAGNPALPAAVLEVPFQYLYRNRDHSELSRAEQEQRDRDLEDYLLDDLPEQTWSNPGALLARTSAGWPVRQAYLLQDFKVHLTGAPTLAAAEFSILVDDDRVLDFAIPIGVFTLELANTIKVVPQVSVVKFQIRVGGGATDMFASCAYRKVWSRSIRA